MLDIEASFAPVPEFNTTRLLVAERALLSHERRDGVEILTARVIPAIAMPECAIVASSVKALSSAVGDTRPETEAWNPQVGAVFAPPPSEALPEEGFNTPALPDLQASALEQSTLSECVQSPCLDDAGTLARPVTPRRPMRFTFAREAGDAVPVSLPSFNLFDGVFDDDMLKQPELDPRLRRSRERALARIAAHEAALEPEARNLWCDDDFGVERPAASDPQSTLHQAEAATSTRADAVHPRRVVRHITVSRTSERTNLERVQDPLQDHLQRIREALYTVDPSDIPEPQPRPSLHHRLFALMLQLALFLAVLPERLMQTLASLRPASHRPYSFRLSPTGGLAMTTTATAVLIFAANGHPLLM